MASLKGITSHTSFHKHFNGAPPLLEGGVVITILNVVIEGQWPSDMEMVMKQILKCKGRQVSRGIVEKCFENRDIDLLESSMELGDKVFN